MLTTPKDHRKEALDLLHRQETVVRIEDNIVKINIGSINPYEIGLHELDSERCILKWVTHLTNKKGVDRVTIRMFIEKALENLDQNKTRK